MIPTDGDGGAAGRPLRVLVYSDSGESFGAEAVFGELTNALAAAPDIELTIVLARENVLLQETLGRLTGTPMLLVPEHKPNNVPFGLWNPWRGMIVRRLLAARDVDAIIVNLPGVEFGAAPLVWSNTASTAMLGIVHLHHRIASGVIRRPLAGPRDRVIAPVLGRLDHAWLVSPRATDSMAFSWAVDPRRCSVLPLVAPHPSRFDRVTARRRLGLPLDRKLVGIVGRVEMAQKGHDTFVGAAERVCRERSDVGFVVVGDGADTEAVRAMVAAAGLNDRFTFLGVLRPADLAYSALDALALPSRFEGLPLVALEALEARLPGVATDVDGLGAVWPREWTVPVDDPDALAAGLQRVLELSQGRCDEVLAEARRRAAPLLTEDQAAAVIPVIRAAVCFRAVRRRQPLRAARK